MLGHTHREAMAAWVLAPESAAPAMAPPAASPAAVPAAAPPATEDQVVDESLCLEPIVEVDFVVEHSWQSKEGQRRKGEEPSAPGQVCGGTSSLSGGAALNIGMAIGIARDEAAAAGGAGLDCAGGPGQAETSEEEAWAEEEVLIREVHPWEFQACQCE